MDVVRHEHNPDRARDNGWACWRCTGCDQLCHYVPATPNPPGSDFYGYCPCCTTAGTMPCLACGDPCLPTEHAVHIQTKHPLCTCGLIKGGALFECACEDPTEAEFDAMMAEGTPVQSVDKPEH